MTDPWPSVVELAESVRSASARRSSCSTGPSQRSTRATPLNAFVHVDAELARRAAEAVDATVAGGEDPGPFAGVPFGVKDLEDCAGMPTSHGSLLFKGRGPGSSTTRSTSPACGPPARCRSARRRRPSSAP